MPAANIRNCCTKNDIMEKVIKYLEERRSQIVGYLQNGEKTYLSELQEIDKSINWLKKIEELQLKIVQKYDIIELPDMQTGYSEFHIMNDCETDDISQWVELTNDNFPVSITSGDILIISKPE